MRNLKRALSLTLASVMLLGMMVVGAGAASYPDVSEEDNIEAIEVLQAVQVMRGDDKGNFNPDSPVTRAEMAVVMALLLDLDYQYYEVTCPFTDVPSWARSYVGACYANKIVAGYDATTYGANDSVTAVQASAMMMRALGYFQTDADYADGFETATVRQGTRIGIYNGVGSRADQAMTRNQVAQMALNALECTMVDAKKSTSDITVGSGDTAVTINGSVEYIVRTSNESFASAINRSEINGTGTNGVYGKTVELGEQLYNGDLKKTSHEDAFGAPATVWTYRNSEIGRYANEADAVYTKEVALKDIYKDLGVSGELEAKYVKFVIDGKSESGLKANDGTTSLSGVKLTDADPGDGALKIGGKGSLVKAYYDADATTDKAVITVTNYYLAKAEDDYSADDEEVDLDIYGDDSEYGTLTVKNSDVAVSGVEKDDYLVVTIADGKVKTAVPAEVVADVQVSVARDKDYVTAGGQRYEYNDVAKNSGDALGNDYITDKDEYNLNDSTYNLYLDFYGYVLGVEAVEENASVSDYLVVTKEATNVGYDVVVEVMFTDGTKDTITVSKVDDDDAATTALNRTGMFYTFKTRSNGKYELTTVPTTGTNIAHSPTNSGTGVNGGIDSKVQPITEVNKTGTNSTVFIADGKVYTGVRNAPKVDATESGIFYVLDKNDRLLIVWTAAKGKTQTSSDDLVYILNTSPAVTRDGDDTYYLYKAIYQGKTVEDFASNDRVSDRGLYAIDSYENGRADLSRDRLVSKLAADDDTYVYEKGITGITSKDDVLTVEGTDAAGDYFLAEDCKIFTIDGTTVRQPSADSLSTARTITRDGFDTITLVRAEDDDDADVIAIYLSKASESPNPTVTKGDPVDNPTADDLNEAIGNGVSGSDPDAGIEVEVSGKVPGGTFGGNGAKLPTLKLDGAEIDEDTVVNGDVKVTDDTTIGSNGSLETLAVDVAAGKTFTVESGGELSCIDITAQSTSKIVWGDTTYTFTSKVYFHTSTKQNGIVITDTNVVGERVADGGAWQTALEAAVSKGWATKTTT